MRYLETLNAGDCVKIGNGAYVVIAFFAQKSHINIVMDFGTPCGDYLL
jgi:hypothetical protein